MSDPKAALAARLLPLIDLTSLNDARDDDIAGLCRAAQTPHGPVAAVCSWPVFAGAAKERLSGAGIAVAAVLNFPEGTTPLAAVLEEAEAAMAAGADELDLVWPYQAWLAGERRLMAALVPPSRQITGSEGGLEGPSGRPLASDGRQGRGGRRPRVS